MKRKRKNDIYVEGSRVEQVREGENEKQWRDEKVRGKRKSWRSVNIKNINVKNNYKKIGKKKVNDVDADVAQLEHSNNKCCASVYIYIYMQKMKQSPSKLDTQNQIDRLSTSKSIVDENDILKYFIAFDIAPCGPV